jgi:hypothetical protein
MEAIETSRRCAIEREACASRREIEAVFAAESDFRVFLEREWHRSRRHLAAPIAAPSPAPAPSRSRKSTQQLLSGDAAHPQPKVRRQRSPVVPVCSHRHKTSAVVAAASPQARRNLAVEESMRGVSAATIAKISALVAADA